MVLALAFFACFSGFLFSGNFSSFFGLFGFSKGLRFT